MLVESMKEAHEAFKRLPFPDASSLNSLIIGYVIHGGSHQALELYKEQHVVLQLSEHAYVALLQACRKMKQPSQGIELHLNICKKGLLERNLFIGNTLVDMYVKCGLLKEAQKVFDNTLGRDVVLWTALISGYADHGYGQEALNCFQKMLEEGIIPDFVTYICGLKACGSIKSTRKGQEMHGELTKTGSDGELLVGNTLVDMYAKCGHIVEAQDVFDRSPIRSVVSWNALIAAYSEHQCGAKALECFEQMQYEGIFPDVVTFVSALRACGSIAATSRGQWIHCVVTREGIEQDLMVGSTLVYMYAKCGLLVKSQEVFDKLPDQDVISWTALIAGYSQRGESKRVFDMFERMVSGGVRPNEVTFVSVLNACNHAGLVDKGRKYFENMSRDYGITPNHKHYTCIIDLLGRAGHLNEAMATIKKMPFHPGIIVWHTVLAACHKWGNVEIGRQAFTHTIRIDDKDASAYICMANIYANAGMKDAANKIEAMRVENGAWSKARYDDSPTTVFSDWEMIAQ
jgi:pentatricopeptide repeat protein